MRWGWGLHEKGLSPQPPGAFGPFMTMSDLGILNLRLKLGWPRLDLLLPMVAEGGEVECLWEWLYQGEKGSNKSGGMEQGVLGDREALGDSLEGPR